LADLSTIKKQSNPELGLQIYKTEGIYHKITKHVRTYLYTSSVLRL